MIRSAYSIANILTILLAILCLSACSAPRFQSPETAKLECGHLWSDIELQLDDQQLIDAANMRLSGFPYLRGNRFLAAMATDLQDREQHRYLGQQLRQLDLEGRYRELERLPLDIQQQLSQRWTGTESLGALKAKVAKCSAKLLRNDLKLDDFYPRLQQALTIDDDYSRWQRTLGLYPLFVWPVQALANNAHRNIRQRVSDFDPNSSDGQVWQSYHPAEKKPLSAKVLKSIVTSSRDNILGIHDLSDGDRQRLAASFAPLLRQQQRSNDDLIGQISVAGEDDAIVVNTSQPVVYYYFSQTKLQTLPALQINYVFWYPARSNEEVSWLERGQLDGMTLRYTLNRRGQVVMVDMINNCGCYHGFLPDPTFFDIEQLQQPEMSEQILQPLPTLAERQRLQFTLDARHLFVHAGVVNNSDQSAPYQLRPYSDLEQLTTEDGEVLSLFDHRGIVANSARVETALLYPMGIPSVGSMRQRGHHPTTLVGREHFDNPLLFDNLFHYLKPLPEDGGHIHNHGTDLSRPINSMKIESLPPQTALTISGGHSYAPGNEIRFAQIGLSARWDYDQIWPHHAPEPLLFKVETAIGVASTPHCRALFSANMLAHYSLNGLSSHRFNPYVEAGIGVIYSDFQIKKQGLRLNFNPLLGIGTDFHSDDDRHGFIAVRLHHISNAELHDDNHGINSLLLQLGHFF